jgi:hypothetical protein
MEKRQIILRLFVPVHEQAAKAIHPGIGPLRGALSDEAALHGVLINVRDLALPLLAVNRMATGAEMQESHEADGGTNSETW